MRESVQAEVMMSFLVSEELSFRIPVELRYETCDPYAVRLTFHLPGDAPVTWAFGRELLIDGVGRPCGDGDVHIAPADPEALGEVLIRLQVGGDHALFRSGTATVVSCSGSSAAAAGTATRREPAPTRTAAVTAVRRGRGIGGSCQR